MKVITVLVILVAVVAVGLGWYVVVRKPNEPSESDLPKIEGVLTVKQVSEHPEKVPGQIRILGVVSQIEEDQALFGLVDETEGFSCLPEECSDCLVPVSWDGLMPEIGQTVIVTGQIESSQQGLVVAASRVDRQ
jgi:hypothetical protein